MKRTELVKGKKLLGLVILLTAVSFVGCQQKKGGSSSVSGSASSVSPSSEDEKTLYTLGVMFGGKLKDLSLSDTELNMMVGGLRDSATGKKPAVDVAKYQVKVQQLFRERLTKMSKVHKEAGAKFLEGFVKNEGGKKTKSGLAYKILTPGKGKPPKATDVVEVHYHGTLTDGTVFDSSVNRNKKISFPLNRVIKGWTEGLQLVRPGGKIKLVIPSELAYGNHGAPPKIPGGATLVFEIELFKVTPGKEAKNEKRPKITLKKPKK